MPAPAVTITTAASPVPRSSPTDTGVLFMAGMSLTGPAGTPTTSRLLTTNDKCSSLNDWISKYAAGDAASARLSYSVDYDAIEAYFRNGGRDLYYSRVVGPTPVKASLNLVGTGTTLVVTADEYGAWFNTNYKIAVINGPVGGAGFRVIQLFKADGVTLIAQTPEIATQAGFAGLKLGLSTITLGGGSGLPNVLAATALATVTGTDDRVNITQTQVDFALTQMFIDLGPGQVCAPNWQTSACHLSLLAHGAGYNRFGLCDPVDTATRSTVTANAALLKGTTNGSWGSLYHPWEQIPPLAAGGSARSVPPSTSVAAKMATTDVTDTPSQAPAGAWGVIDFATGVNATWSRVPAGTSDADVLADAGVNLIIVKNGAVTIFDILTLAPTDDEFQQIGVSRWRMQTVALVGAAAGGTQFARVNRNNLTVWKSKVDAILLRQYLNDQLFGDLDDDRPETAFNTDVDTPNTTSTINAGGMNINVAARPVKGARMLNISIAVVPITAAVS